jgi:hypothetical protein
LPRVIVGQFDVVVMDNLSSHKAKGVRSWIENQGAKLIYLPSRAILAHIERLRAIRELRISHSGFLSHRLH